MCKNEDCFTGLQFNWLERTAHNGVVVGSSPTKPNFYSMNILKKQTLKNNNIISDLEIFSLSENNEFIKCNLLTSSKNFFFINSDCTDDFFHKAKKTIFIKFGEYNNQVLLNHKLSKKHYLIQFALLFCFLKKNKIQILRGRILKFPINIKKVTPINNRVISLNKKGFVRNRFFIITILGLVFKFERSSQLIFIN